MRLWWFLRLWSLLWHLGLPFVLVYLWRRGRKDPAYSQHVAERFGRYRQHLPGAIWVHAVSLGEMRSAVPLIRALLDRGERVVTTHFTPAGRREAERVFGPEIAAGKLAAVWVPFETAWAYAGFFRAFRPRAGLVMEIEIWPRMIFAARNAGVPLFMCNAQYPTKSMDRDRKLKLRHKLMQGYAGAFVKSDLQARRFASVGVQNIHVTGELRFDQPIPPHLVAAAAIRPELAGDRPVITFASAVEGEDELYLDAIVAALAHPSRPFVVYVPRKPERFDEVAGLLAARGLRFLRRSQALDAALTLPAPPAETDLLLGDSLGEMYFYIALSDRVVTGGGFTPHGAHNIIEPLALKRPVIVGPEIHTIEYPAVEAIAAGVCLRVETAAALTAALTDWQGPGDSAIQTFFAAHSGATEKTLAALDRALTSR
ncbi:3-deoxy-D-manno-octulosonic acid transferase [Tabrizicola aquatica]|uniref:3-deoxy-D-manno-octulosonic acid transferase n=1 Tax=Tabrizicola aquatica TaxID=909926 RepID=UPI000CD1412F|nr:glycosyltransferase N-terminal domain-containing protein [Tabrizicola aquatica]